MGGGVRATGAVALLALVASGCATKRDVRDLRSEMRAQAARHDTLLVRIQSTLSFVMDSMQVASLTDLRENAALTRQLTSIQDELARIAQVGETNARNVQMIRDQVEGAARRPRPSTGPASTPAPAFDDDEADAVFDAAFQQYRLQSLSAAQTGFERFMQQYPNHPMAPSAQYYLADILVLQDRIDEAIGAFLRIPERFPVAERVPEAYYRVGVLELERGNPDAARRHFTRVVESFPDSLVAEQARERLSEIG